MIIYVTEKKVNRRWVPISMGPKLQCEEAARYYNGCAYGTRKAIYRVKEYVRK
jgi:hypothetical protein